ncbi:MAG: hypothetical protein ABUL50_00035 [Rhizobacter sp.]
MKRWFSHALCSTAVVLGALSVTGCGNVIFQGVENFQVPFFLEEPDADVACTNATAFKPFVTSLKFLGGDPSLLESLMLFQSSQCSYARASEQELRYIRAQREKRTDEAIDARNEQKHWMEITTEREYRAYESMRVKLEHKYFFKYGETCPHAMRRDFDEMVYLFGTLAGLQAMQHDMSIQQVVGVPTDIAGKANFALSCLDEGANIRLWGVPEATHAAIWSLLPGAGEGKDIKGAFDHAMKIGEAQGVRLAHVVAAQTAVSLDDSDRLRKILRRFANAKGFKPSKDYRAIDDASVAQMQIISDRYWTQNQGSRTPVGSLGKFWDDNTGPAGGASAPDVDQFLN